MQFSFSIEVLAGAAINLLFWGFTAGALIQRMKALERAVLNGITTEIQEHGRELRKQGEELAAINERCKLRAQLHPGHTESNN
jgi:hypothetical protein